MNLLVHCGKWIYDDSMIYLRYRNMSATSNMAKALSYDSNVNNARGVLSLSCIMCGGGGANIRALKVIHFRPPLMTFIEATRRSNSSAVRLAANKPQKLTNVLTGRGVLFLLKSPEVGERETSSPAAD